MTRRVGTVFVGFFMLFAVAPCVPQPWQRAVQTVCECEEPSELQGLVGDAETLVGDVEAWIDGLGEE